MAWIAYALAWLAAALFWALASGSSAGVSPLATLPYGVLGMAFAGVMGVAVWRLTARVAFDWRTPAFYGLHVPACVIYATVYATSWLWVDVATGRVAQAIDQLRTSPVLFWNLLRGTWLYLLVAGIAYAIRAQRRARVQEAAAAEARLLAQQAQVAALRARINPHFLFNALHSVGALVAIDPVRADQALERLGDLLRYALDAADEEPLGREWQFTRDYLALEDLRLGDRLRVDHDVHPAALSVPVPPLILQPLVENAVRHGIADRPEGGRIDIRARIEDRHLLITVSDDGHGTGAGRSTGGFGLASVRGRLAALYGDQAVFEAARTPAGFSVTIGLPLPAAAGQDTAA